MMQGLEDVVDVLEPIKGNASASEQIAMYMATEENVLYAFYICTSDSISRSVDMEVQSIILVHRKLYITLYISYRHSHNLTKNVNHSNACSP